VRPAHPDHALSHLNLGQTSAAAKRESERATCLLRRRRPAPRRPVPPPPPPWPAPPGNQVPSGLLPVLELDGRVVTESAVIMNLLEEAFPGHKPLMPPPGTPERARADALMRLERRCCGSWLVGWGGAAGNGGGGGVWWGSGRVRLRAAAAGWQPPSRLTTEP
jgi:glutathione S-transferase